VLDLAYAKREHDVHDAANHGERRDPGDEKNGAATVVAGGQKPSASSMIPAINCTHHTSISYRTEIDSTMSNVPAKIRMKLKTPASAAKVSPGCMNATIPGDDEDEREEAVQQPPPPVGEKQHPDLEHAGCQRHDPEQDRDRRHGRVAGRSHSATAGRFGPPATSVGADCRNGARSARPASTRYL
jgi:hypothetical protein